MGIDLEVFWCSLKNIPWRPLNEHPKFPDLELIVFELHQSKRKWLFLGIYKPPCQDDIEFLNWIDSVLDQYLTIYENIILIGDFNTHLEATLENYDLNDLIATWIILLATSLITPLALILFWPTERTYSSYLTLLKRVFLTTINLSQLFWNQED